MSTMTPHDVRNKLTEALALDLIGPEPDSPHAGETLPQAPSRWYLTGFLVPIEAGETQKVDETVTEEVDKAAEGAGTDDATTPDAGASRRALFPSSMGLSLLAPKDAKELTVTVRWGDYEPLFDEVPPGEEPPAQHPLPKAWKRKQRSETVTVKLPQSLKPVERDIPNSGGLKLALSIRTVKDIPAFELVQQRGTVRVGVRRESTQTGTG